MDAVDAAATHHPEWKRVTPLCLEGPLEAEDAGNRAGNVGAQSTIIAAAVLKDIRGDFKKFVGP